MSRFEAINCDGPSCVSNERMNLDLDYPANWLTVYDVQQEGDRSRIDELHFCCYSCLARFATHKEQQQQARITIAPEKGPEPKPPSVGLPKMPRIPSS